jgi:hypothetical protein
MYLVFSHTAVIVSGFGSARFLLINVENLEVLT